MENKSLGLRTLLCIGRAILLSSLGSLTLIPFTLHYAMSSFFQPDSWDGILQFPTMRRRIRWLPEGESMFPWNNTFAISSTFAVTPLILSCLHALRLCFLLTLFVRPDCFYRLPDSLRTLPLSRYLAALVSTRLTMLTFLFRLCFLLKSSSCARLIPR